MTRGVCGCDLVWERDDTVLRIDMRRCPDRDETDALFDELQRVTNSRERPFVLHMRHVEDGSAFEPPTLPMLVHIVSQIVQKLRRPEVLARVVVQPQCMDDKVCAAQQSLLSLLPGVTIRIAANPARATESIERGLRKC